MIVRIRLYYLEFEFDFGRRFQVGGEHRNIASSQGFRVGASRVAATDATPRARNPVCATQGITMAFLAHAMRRAGALAFAAQGGVRALATTPTPEKLFTDDGLRPPCKVSGIEGKYASALWCVAKRANKLDAVEKDLDNVSDAVCGEERMSDPFP